MVEVTVDSVDTFYRPPGDHVFTFDISEGGLFIIAHRPPAIGTRLRFQFTLPDSDEPIVALGEVQWVTGTMELPSLMSSKKDISRLAHPSGMGVRFLEVSDEHATRIRRFIRTNREAEVPREIGDGE